MNNILSGQTFISPYLGYGVTNINYPITLRPFSVDQEFSHKRLYSPSIYLGFSIVKTVNEYWNIDLQSDISYQKFSVRDHSFLGSNGAYFWHFRNSVIPSLNIGEKWRSGIGFNVDYLSSNHSHYRQIEKRVDFGGILQVDYQLNK